MLILRQRRVKVGSPDRVCCPAGKLMNSLWVFYGNFTASAF